MKMVNYSAGHYGLYRFLWDMYFPETDAVAPKGYWQYWAALAIFLLLSPLVLTAWSIFGLFSLLAMIGLGIYLRVRFLARS